MTQQQTAAVKPAPDLQKLVELINSVIYDQRNSIIGRQVLLLRNVVDELRAAAGAAA
jgi:hypothetical protein